MVLTLIFLLGCSAFLSKVSADCQPGFVQHGGSCYHFSHDLEEWFVAAGICRTIYGGMLVEINTDLENTLLVAEATKRNTEYWIGANDLQVEGEWRWLTSNTLVTSPKWGATPDNSNNDENCAEINTGGWNDDSCHKAQHYICEIEDETIVVG